MVDATTTAAGGPPSPSALSMTQPPQPVGVSARTPADTEKTPHHTPLVSTSVTFPEDTYAGLQARWASALGTPDDQQGAPAPPSFRIRVKPNVPGAIDLSDTMVQGGGLLPEEAPPQAAIRDLIDTSSQLRNSAVAGGPVQPPATAAAAVEGPTQPGPTVAAATMQGAPVTQPPPVARPQLRPPPPPRPSAVRALVAAPPQQEEQRLGVGGGAAPTPPDVIDWEEDAVNADEEKHIEKQQPEKGPMEDTLHENEGEFSTRIQAEDAPVSPPPPAPASTPPRTSSPPPDARRRGGGRRAPPKSQGPPPRETRHADVADGVYAAGRPREGHGDREEHNREEPQRDGEDVEVAALLRELSSYRNRVADVSQLAQQLGPEVEHLGRALRCVLLFWVVV